MGCFTFKALSLGIIGSLTVAGAQAHAQSNEVSVPQPENLLIDENGVNLETGYIKLPTPKISIGPIHNLLKFDEMNNVDLAIFYNDNHGQPDVSAEVLGDIEASSELFRGSSSGFSSRAGNGSLLTLNGSIYTLTQSDGTKYVYGNTDKETSDALYDNGLVGRLTEIVRPDGLKTTFSYKRAQYTCPNSYCGSYGGSVEVKVRLQSISRSDGYSLHFNYLSNQTGTGNQQRDWDRVASVVAFNRTKDYCAPTADVCTFTKQWPTLSYTTIPFDPSSSTGGTFVTTPAGTARYLGELGSDGKITNHYQRAGSPEANITVINGNYTTSGRVETVTRDGVTWNYSWTRTRVFYPYVGYSMASVRTNPDGSTRTVVTNNGRISSVTDEAGNIWSFTYDNFKRVTQATAPDGRATNYLYDARGNITTTTKVAKPGSGLANIVTTASFPSSCSNIKICNQPSWTRDPLGKQTDYTYDATHGGVLTITGPANASGVRPQTRFGYTPVQSYSKNAAGSIVASGLPVYKSTSVSTCLSATIANPASCIGTPAEQRQSYSFGPQVAGTANNLLPVSETVSSGDGSLVATTVSTFNDLGDLTSTDGPLTGAADTTVYRYDPARRIVGVIWPDPDGPGPRKPFARRTSYSSEGLVTLIENGTVNDRWDASWTNFSSQQQIAITYDANARPIKTQTSGGGSTYSVTQQNYDASGRVKCTTIRMDPAQWSGQNDPCTPQSSGTNGPDRVTRNTYDALGRIITVSDAVGTVEAAITQTNTYTVSGQLASVKDAEGNKTTYVYDGFDRLIKTRYPIPSKGANTSSASDYESLSYNARGNVIARQLRDGSIITYSYDNLGQLTLKNLPGSEADVTYGYNLLGQSTTTSSGGQTLTNSFDALGRLSSTVQPLGTTVYGYDVAGRRKSMSYPGGSLTINYDYDVTGNITKIRENGATSGVGLLANYSYDGLGRVESVTYGNGAVQSYTYDGASRLSSLTNNLGGSATAHDLISAFTYNPANQITAETRSNDAYRFTSFVNVNRDYTQNGLNQYTSAGSTAFTYDLRGNLETSGGDSFTYSSENFLTGAAGTASLTYDPLGRLWQVNDLTSGGGTARFAYDGVDLISEYSTSGTVLHRYVHGPGIDNPIVWYEGSTVASSTRRFLTGDERGSIISITDSAGATLGINSYDEYGIPAATNVGRFGYTGQTWIPELGMWYYKARMYSPTMGRFLQTDPIGYEDGLNWYSYVNNDPINLTDPSGLEGLGGPDIVVTSTRPMQRFTSNPINVTGITGINVNIEIVPGLNVNNAGKGSKDVLDEALSDLDGAYQDIVNALKEARDAARQAEDAVKDAYIIVTAARLQAISERGTGQEMFPLGTVSRDVVWFELRATVGGNVANPKPGVWVLRVTPKSVITYRTSTTGRGPTLDFRNPSLNDKGLVKFRFRY